MRKLLLILGLLILCFSTIGWQGNYGWKSDNRWSGNLYFNSTVVASGHKAGVTTNVSTESTLTSAALAFGMINLQVGSAKTIGIDDGSPGQMVTIRCSVRDGANAVISKTAFPVTTHSTGWDTLTFDAVGDWITLLYMDNAIGWMAVGQNGMTIN